MKKNDELKIWQMKQFSSSKQTSSRQCIMKEYLFNGQHSELISILVNKNKHITKRLFKNHYLIKSSQLHWIFNTGADLQSYSFELMLITGLQVRVNGQRKKDLLLVQVCSKLLLLALPQQNSCSARFFVYGKAVCHKLSASASALRHAA